MRKPGNLSGILTLSLAALIAVLLGGCDPLDDYPDSEEFEPPPDPCGDLWNDVFNSCMEQGDCIGLSCLELLDYCAMEANTKKAQCCQSMGGCTTIVATEVSDSSPGPSP